MMQVSTMYFNLGNIFVEDTMEWTRLGHHITIGANPVMTVFTGYPRLMTIEFPVFV